MNKNFINIAWKYLRVNANVDYLTRLVNKRLEEKIQTIQRSLQHLNMRHNELWCTTCLKECHTKGNCPYDEPKRYHDDINTNKIEMKQLKEDLRIFTK